MRSGPVRSGPGVNAAPCLQEVGCEGRRPKRRGHRRDGDELPAPPRVHRRCLPRSRAAGCAMVGLATDQVVVVVVGSSRPQLAGTLVSWSWEGSRDSILHQWLTGVSLLLELVELFDWDWLLRRTKGARLAATRCLCHTERSVRGLMISAAPAPRSAGPPRSAFFQGSFRLLPAGIGLHCSKDSRHARNSSFSQIIWWKRS